MHSAVYQQDGMQNVRRTPKNEKKDLCGQLPLVESKSISIVKKTADFLRNQPFLLVRVGRFELPAS